MSTIIQKTFGNFGLVISVALGLTLLFVMLTYPNDLQTKYKKLETECEKLRKEKAETDKNWEELLQQEKELFQGQLDTHEENTLKVFDQLFVEERDYPFFYSSKGVASEFHLRLLGDKGPTYTVVFEKGGTVMGTNSNRETWTFTSPRKTIVYLDSNNRVTEVKGIVYQSRY